MIKTFVQRFLPEELIRILQTAYWSVRFYRALQEF